MSDVEKRLPQKLSHQRGACVRGAFIIFPITVTLWLFATVISCEADESPRGRAPGPGGEKFLAVVDSRISVGGLSDLVQNDSEPLLSLMCSRKLANILLLVGREVWRTRETLLPAVLCHCIARQSDVCVKFVV